MRFKICSSFILTWCVVPFLLSLCDFNLGSLDVNGARADFKRATLFKLMEIKKTKIMFVQETLSTADNESEWRQALNREVQPQRKGGN